MIWGRKCLPEAWFCAICYRIGQTPRLAPRVLSSLLVTSYPFRPKDARSLRQRLTNALRNSATLDEAASNQKSVLKKVIFFQAKFL